MSEAETWYQASAPRPKSWPQAYDMDVDVAIIGGGYTGLGTAIELAQNGVNVAVFEAGSIGNGASGRNGGQWHRGQRLDPLSLTRKLGKQTARALWDMAEEASLDLFAMIRENGIDCDLRGGLIHAWHRSRFEAEDRAYADTVAAWGDGDRLRFLSKAEVAEHLGTDVYHGGMLDIGGRHLHPLKLLYGLAHLAEAAGAKLFENSRIVSTQAMQDHVRLRCANGAGITCAKLLLCGNGLMSGLEAQTDSHVLPIHNFMIATAPLDDPAILPTDCAVSDSRFVVNYFRKARDNRLIFGGGEGYGTGFPNDIAARVRRNMLKIYPQLAKVEITHAWGGTLAVTRSRAPFIRRLSQNVWVSAGYSGQGVVLAPWCGKLLARSVLGNDSGLELMAKMPAPPFPGGRLMRRSLLAAALRWYGLRDRF